MTTDGAALAVREPDTLDLAPRMVVSLSDLRENLSQLDEFKRSIMVEGVDFGTIPGTPKPTLLKPGAEKLSLAFGLAPNFEPANRIEDWERGFFHYEERCILISRRSGQTVATANGSANSREPRYRWRDAKPTCPDCGMDLRRSKRREGDTDEPGWYCWAKTGGCGATWPKDTVKAVGRIENPEPYELCNTIMKMAQKRALVAAVLIATGGSGIWTQDVEDMPSVAGEQVIDADFRQTETSQPARPASKPQPMVTSENDPMWQRWLDLKREAEGRGVQVPDLGLPIGRVMLQAEGAKVRAAVNDLPNTADLPSAVVASGASADESPTESADATPEMVTAKSHPAWKAWQAALKRAEEARIDLPPTGVTLPISRESLEASTASLLEVIGEADIESTPF